MNSKVHINPKAQVSLQEINAQTVRSICELKVSPEQNRFVTPVAISIAQAYFEPKAWFRAIYADETPVGFVMLYEDVEKPMYSVWRFLIDARYQRMGFGKQAMKLLIERVRNRPHATELYVKYVPDRDGPARFYQKLGSNQLVRWKVSRKLLV